MKKILALMAAATLAGCVVVPGGGFPNPNGPPTYGSATVNPGFTQTVSVASGGNVNAAVLGNNCNGFIATNPDFNVQFNTLFGLIPLAISVSSGADTTLVVQRPDGVYVCNDDFNGLNPRIQINSPVAGVYHVWVGTYGGTGIFNSTLRFN